MDPRRVVASLLDSQMAIEWDQKGIGSVPKQADVGYFGFEKFMTPSEFLNLVPPGVSGPNTKRFIIDAVMKGSRIAPPFLIVKWSEPEQAWKVSDHEGRSRARAAKELEPDGKMPVAILPIGLRARDLSPEMLAAGFVPQLGSSGLLNQSP